MSILEEATISVVLPKMGVSNNLVVYDGCGLHLGPAARQGDRKVAPNPRKVRYQNVESVTADSDSEAVFHLKRPQPALLYRHPP
jgi:hypothetical protein